MELNNFLQRLNDAPEGVSFNDSIALIESLYEFTPSAFSNAGLVSEAGQNSGSCKIFTFAHLHGLTEQQTLHCFGAYYRDEVLNHPEGADHQNIRHFMQTGWAGVVFKESALTPKQPD